MGGHIAYKAFPFHDYPLVRRQYVKAINYEYWSYGDYDAGEKGQQDLIEVLKGGQRLEQGNPQRVEIPVPTEN